MKIAQLGLSVGIGVLLAGIFLVDSRMALGYTPWLLYVIPLGLTYWVSSQYAPLVVAALCTILVVAGFELSPPLVPEQVALINRIFGAIMFWAFASLIMAYKLLVLRLSQLTVQLRSELDERTQDLGRAVSALRAQEGAGKGLAPEGGDGLEKTRGDLEQLGKQLEALQRHLLRP